VNKRSILNGLALSLGVVLSTGAVLGNDWPFWRGPEQSGMSREKAAVTGWTPDNAQLIWKIPIGGRSTPIVMKGRVYLLGPVGKGPGLQERLTCVDAETGKTVWEHRFNVFHSDVVEERVGWTAPVGDPESGNVYVHGTGGELMCFDRDGNVKWKVSMTEELGRISGYGGRLHTPIIDENLVIVSFLNSGWGDHAPGKHRYAAFDKREGKINWWAAPGGKPEDTTYSCPVVTTIDGVRMLIAANADGNVYGMKARTGETLWTLQLSKRGLNSSVVDDGKYAYIGHSEENLDNTEMGRLVCIDASKRGDITETGEVWRLPECTVGYASPAIANGRLYAVTNAATLLAVNATTGKEIWTYDLGRVGKGSPTVTSDGVIYVAEQTGVFHILRDEGDKCVSLASRAFERADNLIDDIYGSPAVSDGRVYFMTRYNTYCLGTKGRPGESVPVPSMGGQAAQSPLPATHIHLVPAEVTLSPGESVRISAFFFDEAGRSCKPSDVSFSTTIGEIKTLEDSGVLITAGTSNSFSAGYVTAKTDGLEARSRVRISPSLPIDENFDSMEPGKPPPGWVGAGGRAVIAERDGSMALRKLASKERPSPPFMRMRAYATPPIDGGYTVQADLLGTLKGKRFKPDMGLINSRYRFIMLGMSDVLRIETWSPIPRLRKDEPFLWDANQWYRVKFDVKLDAEQAKVRAKVWPRESEEPAAWTIEMVDPSPNREGSAGVYGYSTNTTAKSDGPEIFYDNFKVTRND